MSTVILIAAVCATAKDTEGRPDYTKEWAIGYNGKLPFKAPDDMKRFRTVTMGDHVIMGRKTFESCGVLDGRRMYVVSRNADFEVPEGVTLCPTLEAAVSLSKLDATKGEYTFIAGGAEIYSQSMAKDIPDALDITFLNQVCTHYDATFPRVSVDENGSLDDYGLSSLDVKSYGTVAIYHISRED